MRSCSQSRRAHCSTKTIRDITNAHEETLQARKKEHDPNYHEEMARLYAQHVLKEQPAIQIQGLGGKKKSPVQDVLHKPQV